MYLNYLRNSILTFYYIIITTQTILILFIYAYYDTRSETYKYKLKFNEVIEYIYIIGLHNTKYNLIKKIIDYKVNTTLNVRDRSTPIPRHGNTFTVNTITTQFSITVIV